MDRNHSLHLLQILLPDPEAPIVTAHVQGSHQVSDVIAATIRDAANASALQEVFGPHFHLPTESSDTTELSHVGTWVCDRHGSRWALQDARGGQVRKQELSAIPNGSGLLPLHLNILEYLGSVTEPDGEAGTSSSSTPDFTSSVHLQGPRLRLVCGNSGLALRLRFTHIPEATEHWSHRLWFLPAHSEATDNKASSKTGGSASHLVAIVTEELRLPQIVVEGTKTARIQYAIAIPPSSGAKDVSEAGMLPPSPLPASTSIPCLLEAMQGQSRNHNGNESDFPTLMFTVDRTWLSHQSTLSTAFIKQMLKNDGKDCQLRASSGTKQGGGMLSLWGMASQSKAAAPVASLVSDLGEATQDDGDTGRSGSTLKGKATGEVEPFVRPKRGEGQKAITTTATARLSRMFEGWGVPTPHQEVSAVPAEANGSYRSTRTLSVSGPRDVPTIEPLDSGHSISITGAKSSVEEDDLEHRFDLLIRELGIRGSSREAMLKLPEDRKRFLVDQNDATKSHSYESPSPPPQANPRTSNARGSEDGEQGLIKSVTRALQMGWTNRFSIVSWSGESMDGEMGDVSTAGPGENTVLFPESPSNKESRTPGNQAVHEIMAQDTGASISSSGAASLWSSWWGPGGSSTSSQSSHSKGGTVTDKQSPQYYASMLSEAVKQFPSRKDLVKHLISLRVTLASAKLSWVSSFVKEDGGLNALDRLLAKETEGLLLSHGRFGGKIDSRASSANRASYQDRHELSDTVIGEVLKCLRGVMNTDVGFHAVLARPSIVVSIAYSLKTNSYKLCSQAADVLAALCVLSYDEGHRLVLSALSELKVATGNKFRFDFIVDSMRLKKRNDQDSDTSSLLDFGEETVDPELKLDDLDQEEEAAKWDFRVSVMVLVNALVNCPEDLEDRVALRDEFHRRGLNDALLDLRAHDLPDALLTQIQIYAEEKQEDLDMLERERKGGASNGDDGAIGRLGDAGGVLLDIVAEHPDIYPQVESMIRHISHTLGRDIDHQLKLDILYTLEKFLEHSGDLVDFEEGWRSFMKAYLSSVQHLVGTQALIKGNRISDTSTVPSSFLEELEDLRSQVEDLSEEKSKLKDQLHEQVARGNMLQSFPPREQQTSAEGNTSDSTAQVSAGDHESFPGVIQRLVQKEKQVLALQAEVDSLSKAGGIVGSSGGDDQRAKRERQERSRQWTNLMEEIARNKAQMSEMEVQLEQSRKEVAYLKRALEAVYGRFQNNGSKTGPSSSEDSSHVSPVAKRQVNKIDEATKIGPSAEEMVQQSLAGVTKKEDEVSALRAEIAKVQAQALEAVQERTKQENAERQKLLEQVKDGQEKYNKLKAEMNRLQSLFSQLQPTSMDPNCVATPKAHRQAPKPPLPLMGTPLETNGTELVPSTSSIPPPTALPTPPPAMLNSASTSISQPPVPSPPPPSLMAFISSSQNPAAPPTPPLPPPPPPPPPPPVPFTARKVNEQAGKPEHSLPPPPPPPLPQVPPSGQRGLRTVATKAPKLLAADLPPIPPKKRRALFWNKVNNRGPGGTVWNELPRAPMISVVVEDLDQLFALSSAKTKTSGQETVSTNGQGGRASKVTTLLNFTRAQNISIVLAKVRKPLPQIRTALLRVHIGEDDDGHDSENKLTIDNLKALKQCLPTPEEAELFVAHTENISQLSKADQFFKEIQGIPRIQQRLSCMLYARTFELDMEELKPDLKLLNEASRELKKSEKLRTILHTVLAIGNILNSSTFRGAAVGFQMADLLKLKDTKPAQTSAGTPSLLHYLVRVLNNADKSLVGFLDECPHVEAAARLSTPTISATVQQLITGFKAIVEELDVMKKARITMSQDRFLEAMQKFTVDNAPQINGLQKASEGVSKSLNSVLEYYGEDVNSMKPEQFFELVSTFGQMLMRAEVEVLTYDKKAQMEERKKGVGVVASGAKGPVNPSLPQARRKIEAAPRALPGNPRASNPDSGPSASTDEDPETSSTDLTPTGNHLPRLALPPQSSTVVPSLGGGGRGSRFRSWGASAISTLTPVGENDDVHYVGKNDEATGNTQTVQPDLTASRKSCRRRRGQFDEAIKELRNGLPSNTSGGAGFGSGSSGSRFGTAHPTSSLSTSADGLPVTNGHGRDGSNETVRQGSIGGRKSLRLQDSGGSNGNRFHQRPLSRIFLTGGE